MTTEEKIDFLKYAIAWYEKPDNNGGMCNLLMDFCITGGIGIDYDIQNVFPELFVKYRPNEEQIKQHGGFWFPLYGGGNKERLAILRAALNDLTHN